MRRDLPCSLYESIVLPRCTDCHLASQGGRIDEAKLAVKYSCDQSACAVQRNTWRYQQVSTAFSMAAKWSA